MKRLWLLGLVLAAGCSDALERSSSAGQVIAVVNSIENSLSLIAATDLSVTKLGLGPAGTPVSVAGRGSFLIVPLGTANAAAVVDLTRQPAAVSRTVPLAANSGATGAAIQDDSIAWVANPNLNTVTRVNYRTGDTSSVAVGVYPQAVAVVRGRVFVANGNLVNFAPAGLSWLTSFDCCPPGARDSIPLLGFNAQFAVVGDDSMLYVIDSGHLGSGDGKLSIVDPVARTEAAVINGLGDFPGAAAFHPSGRLLISSYGGILEVNTLTRTLTRGPSQSVTPGGDPVVGGLAVDSRGRVFSLAPANCMQPGAVHVLSAPPDYTELKTVPVGVCPFGAAVAVVPPLP